VLCCVFSCQTASRRACWGRMRRQILAHHAQTRSCAHLLCCCASLQMSTLRFVPKLSLHGLATPCSSLHDFSASALHSRRCAHRRVTFSGRNAHWQRLSCHSMSAQGGGQDDSAGRGFTVAGASSGSPLSIAVGKITLRLCSQNWKTMWQVMPSAGCTCARSLIQMRAMATGMHHCGVHAGPSTHRTHCQVRGS
jgi:hypothetical protein